MPAPGRCDTLANARSAHVATTVCTCDGLVRSKLTCTSRAQQQKPPIFPTTESTIYDSTVSAYHACMHLTIRRCRQRDADVIILTGSDPRPYHHVQFWVCQPALTTKVGMPRQQHPSTGATAVQRHLPTCPVHSVSMLTRPM